MKITKQQLRRIIRESLQLEMFDTGSMGDEVGGTSLAQKKEQCELAGGKWISDDPSGKYGHCSKSIKEKLLREADTDVYEGDHDPITVEIPALEALATKKNFDGKKVWFGDTDASTIASALEDGKPSIEDFNYDTARHAEATAEWKKLDDHLSGWDQEEKEELANNIRDALKSADDAGYEY